jgi:hypothetical protein
MNEEIKLSNELLSKLKKIIDQHAHAEKKPKAYNEFLGYYGKGYMTKGQASKIQSFYKNYTTTATPEDAEKKRMYDSVNLLPFVDAQLKHMKNLKQTMTNIHKHTGTGTQTGRSVDRLTKVSKANITPPTPPKPSEIKPTLHEEIQRFNMLTNYDTTEGLQIKRFRVTYQVNGQRIKTILSLYSQSETQAITKLKTNTRLKNKNIVILSIEPVK